MRASPRRMRDNAAPRDGYAAHFGPGGLHQSRSDGFEYDAAQSRGEMGPEIIDGRRPFATCALVVDPRIAELGLPFGLPKYEASRIPA